MASGIGRRLELRGLRSGILGLLMMGRRVVGVGVVMGRFGGGGGSSVCFFWLVVS